MIAEHTHEKYRSDPIFAECVRMFTGLALFLFLLNYTGVPLPDGTLTRAKFPVEFWNVYERMIYDSEYINVEFAYRHLHTIFSCANPNIWRFIEA
ncbi:MULE domain-containing protein [Meloidogyne graminicola]|uniref:MULE domain-containing protein n=1 Tax=Meloidogyne graminicola TaxID=189291 RepID=A0A8S9ZCQ8_9BILA|nr:MULE domain-containing protein [Meloidogyne graminicola]